MLGVAITPPARIDASASFMFFSSKSCLSGEQPTLRTNSCMITRCSPNGDLTFRSGLARGPEAISNATYSDHGVEIVTFRVLLFVPRAVSLFMTAAGLGEHHYPWRTAVALLPATIVMGFGSQRRY